MLIISSWYERFINFTIYVNRLLVPWNNVKGLIGAPRETPAAPCDTGIGALRGAADPRISRSRRRHALSPEDRKVFDSWAIRVAAAYATVAVVICSMAVMFGDSHPPTEQGGVSLTNLAADRSALSDKHP